MRYKYEIVWCITLLGLFIVMPFTLVYFGFGFTKALSFVIGVASMIADGYLTKTALELGCRELNLTFTVLKGKAKADRMLILSRLAGFFILTFVLLLFNEVVLLFFALSFMSCVVANSITILAKVKSGDKIRNYNKSQPKQT